MITYVIMPKCNARILVVDDDRDILLTTRMILGPEFSEVITLEKPDEIPKFIKGGEVDVILLDMNFSPGVTTGAEGIHWLKKIKALDPEVLVLMNTAYGNIKIAVKAMKMGATDFLVKPWRREKLLAVVKTTIERRHSMDKMSRQPSKQKILNRGTETKETSPGDKFSRRLHDIMHQHIGEPDYNMEDLARELNLSRSQVFRKVMALTGYSPNALLRNLRLERAASFFRSGHKNVAQVMYQVGFNNASYFAKCFNDLFGVNPSQYISQQVNESSSIEDY